MKKNENDNKYANISSYIAQTFDEIYNSFY